MYRKMFSCFLMVLACSIAFSQTKSDMFNQKPNFAAKKALDKGVKLLEKGKLNSAEKYLKKLEGEKGYDYLGKGYLAVIKGQQNDHEGSLALFQASIKSFMDYKAHLIERKTDYLKTLELDAITDEQTLGTRKVAYARKTPVSSKGAFDASTTRFVSQGNPALQEQELNTRHSRVSELKEGLERDKAMQYPAFFYFKLGNLLMKSNDIVNAKLVYLNAVASDSEFADIYPNLAVVYFLENDCSNARLMIQKAEKLGAQVSPGFKKDLDDKCSQLK